jgi:hypothetical protein
VLYHRRSHFDDDERKQPLRYDCQGATAESEFERKHLTGIDPHVGLPSESEECVEEVQRDCSPITRTFAPDPNADG